VWYVYCLFKKSLSSQDQIPHWQMLIGGISRSFTFFPFVKMGNPNRIICFAPEIAAPNFKNVLE